MTEPSGSESKWAGVCLLCYLIETTAATLRKVGAKQREWTDKRDTAIVQAHRDGLSLRAIAEAVGMSHMGVKRIVDRQER